jgi:hypothetical protein
MKVSYNCKFLPLFSIQMALAKSLCEAVKIIIPSYISAYTSEYDSNNIYLNFSKINSTLVSKGYCHFTLYTNANNTFGYNFRSILNYNDHNHLYIVDVGEKMTLVVGNNMIIKYEVRLKNNETLIFCINRNKKF